MYIYNCWCLFGDKCYWRYININDCRYIDVSPLTLHHWCYVNILTSLRHFAIEISLTFCGYYSFTDDIILLLHRWRNIDILRWRSDRWRHAVVSAAGCRRSPTRTRRVAQERRCRSRPSTSTPRTTRPNRSSWGHGHRWASRGQCGGSFRGSYGASKA